MKRRLIITTVLILSGFLLFLFSAIFAHGAIRFTLIVTSILLMIYAGIYTFGGLAKIVLYVIYGVVIIVTYLLFSDYNVGISLVSTLVLIINPLSNLEENLEKSFSLEETSPMAVSLTGTFWPFYAYRGAMKEKYHESSTRKLYTKKWYRISRQTTVLLLFGLGIYLLFTQLSGIVIQATISLNNFLILYGVMVVFVMAMLLYKKGFTTTARFLTISLFPAAILLLSFYSFNSPVIQPLFISLTAVLGLGLGIQQLFSYYGRVVFSAYEYFEPALRGKVHANEMYEPLIYNEKFNNVAIYEITLSEKEFLKSFKDIIVYANFYRFIVTAYIISSDRITIYTEFHGNVKKRPIKFKNFLEHRFQTNVSLKVKKDPEKTIYEKTFFQSPEYIICRAQKLAEQAKEIENKTRVVVSVFTTFNDEKDYLRFSNDYNTTRLYELEESHYFAARVDIHIANVDYIIESHLRNLLLDLLIHRGQYVRVQIYY